MFDDFRASYVGLARGIQGIGARLRQHDANRDDWSRFCWFAFDDVCEGPHAGWSQVRRRDALKNISAELILRECEALLITVLGSRNQNEMRFQEARRWHQLRDSDCISGGIGTKVASEGYTDAWLRDVVRGVV